MEQYIFTREYRHRDSEGEIHIIVKKGSILTHTDEGFCTPCGEYPSWCLSKEWTPDLEIHTLKMDADLLKTVFNSFAYTNWLNEKKADIDERGDPLYQGLYKSPETIIMYLMEVGISSDTLMRCIYGPGNKYMEYRYLVQEFGKIL